MYISKIVILSLMLVSGLFVQGQETARIFGKITDEQGRAVELANIAIPGTQVGGTSNMKGEYSFRVPAGRELKIVVSYIGFRPESALLKLKAGEEREINFILKTSLQELDPIEIYENQIRQTNTIRIDPKETEVIPTMKNGVEDLIITQPGVSSSNELSSQYSVRGGNFDENLVYVNGIQIYRPFLIRSGQQEGLSFVNSDLVSSILFSAGGFNAKYGDKMSSVLDIQYKKPTEFAASLSGSLLGGSAHVEGISRDRRFTYLAGFRHQSNQYILKGLQTKGEYKPAFTDVQALFTYDISDRWEISFLGNYANNFYKLVPENRETRFGTINEAYQLRIYFDGQEVDKYETMLGALSLQYQPNPKLNLRFITSAFQTVESETYDIQGQYWIGRLETSFGDEEFGDAIETQGVGTYLDHARNYLQARVISTEHKGSLTRLNKTLQWGLKFQHEIVNDELNEWEMIDSAGYSIPRPQDSIGYLNPPHPALLLNDVAKSNNNINSNRIEGYLQNNWEFAGYKNDIFFTLGGRFNYWDFNRQFLFSPRASFAIKPNRWEKDIVFRFSTGYYYQPPFYKEMRGFQGNINRDIRAQKSIHFVGGLDWNFLIWSRPFKFTTEVYYKMLNDLIPYEVDNVRIRYYADNIAHGYATGIDFKINGEFVRGIESWASLSIMQTEEDIEGDFYYEFYNDEGVQIVPGVTLNDTPADSVRIEPGYIPRPTDQRVNFSLFFQDYLPSNPTYKMHLKLVFGSSLPFGPPDSPKYQHTLRIPAYRRVDIGFSKQIIGEDAVFKPKSALRFIKSLWITAEVFNLLQINNTVSYLWVKDVTNRRYAVPNYLTPRQLNIRLIAKF